MHKLLRIALLLTFALAVSGFGACGQSVRPDRPTCPVLPPPPASLMVKPTTEQKVRAELFAQPQSATPKSAGSRP
jgi:hypothetical protein